MHPNLRSTAPVWVPVGIQRLRASPPHPHPHPQPCPAGMGPVDPRRPPGTLPYGGCARGVPAPAPNAACPTRSWQVEHKVRRQPGLIKYETLVDMNAPNTYCVLTTWSSKAHLNDWLKDPWSVGGAGGDGTGAARGKEARAGQAGRRARGAAEQCVGTQGSRCCPFLSPFFSILP